MIPPALVMHADWSVDPRKRWMACAVRWRDGYLASSPQPVGALATFWSRLATAVGDSPILVGFDFPIGLPAAYARRADIADFVPALVRFGTERWRDFYDVASAPDEISLARPFYPRRPGGSRRDHLWRALKLDGWDGLHRRCDCRTARRLAACPMFWTLGGNQVGRAAITGWRDLLAPARQNGQIAIWPFDGPLPALLGGHRFVVAETYPGEVYGHLGLALRTHGGKRRQAARIASAARLLAWAGQGNVALTPELRTEIEDGFGPDAHADDRFDAVIGLFGLLNVVYGARPSGEPDDPAVQRIEGWILGLDPAELTTARRPSN